MPGVRISEMRVAKERLTSSHPLATESILSKGYSHVKPGNQALDYRNAELRAPNPAHKSHDLNAHSWLHARSQTLMPDIRTPLVTTETLRTLQTGRSTLDAQGRFLNTGRPEPSALNERAKWALTARRPGTRWSDWISQSKLCKQDPAIAPHSRTLRIGR